MLKDQEQQSVPGLEFNVAQLLKETTGATRSYEIEATVTDEFSDDLAVVSSLTGQVRFLRTGPNILATGRLKAAIEKSCGRCLTPFIAVVALELEEEFFPTLDIVTGLAITRAEDIEPANLIDEQHILDLTEVVRQELLLASEESRYCRPNCRGLCPICGQDRNINPCKCEEEAVDPRWAGLQAINLED